MPGEFKSKLESKTPMLGASVEMVGKRESAS